MYKRKKTDKRYTLEGLPIVTEEIRKSFDEEIIRDIRIGDLEPNRMFLRIKEDNPEIFKYIYETACAYPLELMPFICFDMAKIYYLLKSQANQYKVQDFFNIK